jgi:hypothetical protein
VSNNYGRFPFGRPNSVRPMRAPVAAAPRATVVGVYPSAWHVTWTVPSHLVADGARGKVGALAVDVEPTVFWDGNDDFSDTLAEWVDLVGFTEGDHGTIDQRSPSANGSSGRKVAERYLAPGGLTPGQAAFTDVCPVFFVKQGSGKRRGQGDAIATEFDGIAAELGHSQSSLPRRPSPKALVEMAITEFKQRLVSDLEAADAPAVITLGDEVLQVLRRIPELAPAPPADSLADLYPNRYGEEGTLRVNGRTVRWLPLVHPGLLRGTPAVDTSVPASPRTVDGWSVLHARWAVSSAADF